LLNGPYINGHFVVSSTVIKYEIKDIVIQSDTNYKWGTTYAELPT